LAKREIAPEHGKARIAHRFGDPNEERRVAIAAGAMGQDEAAPIRGVPAMEESLDIALFEWNDARLENHFIPLPARNP
jgi:hypothetical protein